MSLLDPVGCRVLVVEDESLIAMFVEDCLHAMGCRIVGPASNLDAAMLLAGTEQIDAALLDITVRGGKVFPVAELLQARGVPVVLASGYGDWALPDDFRDCRRLVKPFTEEDLEACIRSLCVAAATPP